jgi:GTP-binding protein
VALNKRDAIAKADLSKKRAALEKACGHAVFVISGVSGEGVDDVLRALAKEIVKGRVKKEAPRKARAEWSP